MINTRASIPTLLITGTVGAGKTTVGGEISTILCEPAVPHACIDLDRLCQCYPAPEDDPYNQALMFQNLAAIWANFKRRSPQYLVLIRVVENQAELQHYRQAIPEAALTVVRVVAPKAAIRQRLRQREIGSFFDPLWKRSLELAGILDAAQVEDFQVTNDGPSVRSVALAVMEQAGWPRP